MRNGLWLSALCLALAGCGKLITIEPDPDNRYYMPPVGTVVRINEELIVPEGWARVFLQKSETLSYGDLDRYYPSCNFELYTVGDMPQLIKSGRFTITNVRRRDEEVVRYGLVQYASRWLLADGGGVVSEDAMVMRTVRMKLESEQQPGMYMLTCRGALDEQPYARAISIKEMRVALGDKATIVLPQE